MNNEDHVLAVSKVQKYILQNIKNKMTLYEIAEISGYSPWHISRIFKQQCGKSIFEYIRCLKLSKAALVLRDENINVIDTALDFVFDTHEGFTRAFSKEFGITPKKYSKQTPPIKLFIPYLASELKENMKGSVKMCDKTTVVFSQVIERPKRKAIIKRGVNAKHYFEYCEEVGCDIWGELCSIKGALFEPMGMWLPKKLIKSGTSKYVQGVEVPFDYEGIIPKGYDVIELDSCKMMIFQGPKYDDKDFENEVLKVMNAIDEYDPTLFGYKWAYDIAPRFQYEPQGDRGYIEGRPVK